MRETCDGEGRSEGARHCKLLICAILTSLACKALQAPFQVRSLRHPYYFSCSADARPATFRRFRPPRLNPKLIEVEPRLSTLLLRISRMCLTLLLALRLFARNSLATSIPALPRGQARGPGSNYAGITSGPKDQSLAGTTPNLV